MFGLQHIHKKPHIIFFLNINAVLNRIKDRFCNKINTIYTKYEYGRTHVFQSILAEVIAFNFFSLQTYQFIKNCMANLIKENACDYKKKMRKNINKLKGRIFFSNFLIFFEI